MARSGSCRVPGALLLDPGLIILLSEVGESPHKIPSPDLRTNLRHSILERQAIAPGTAPEAPGVCEGLTYT